MINIWNQYWYLVPQVIVMSYLPDPLIPRVSLLFFHVGPRHRQLEV